MHPAHYKSKHHTRGNGVYLCAIVSLSLCLVMTFGYWKREVNALLQTNQQLSNQVTAREQEGAEKNRILNEKMGAIAELEARVGRQEGTISELTNKADKETARADNLEKKAESTTNEYRIIEEAKSEADAKYEAYKKQAAEDIQEKDDRIKELTEQLESEKKKNEDLQLKLSEDNSQKEKHSKLKGAGTNKVTKDLSEASTEAMDNQGGTEKDDSVDPFLLSAPDEHKDETMVRHVRGGVEMTEEFGTETLRNPRTGDPNQIQAETLSDALLTEAANA